MLQDHPKLERGLVSREGQHDAGRGGGGKKTNLAEKGSIGKQELFFVDFRWDALMELAGKRAIEFQELPRQLPVHRDLAMIVDKSLSFGKVEQTVRAIRLDKLQEVKLFDIFENEEKLGRGKKSLAVSFTFLDEEKTLTDKEIDEMIDRIMRALEKEVQAEIRK